MNNEELKPCAHCGAVPLIQEHEPHTHSGPLKAMGIPDHPGSFTIECPTDGCAAMIADTRQEVVAAWNRRAPAAQPASAPVASIDTPDLQRLLAQLNCAAGADTVDGVKRKIIAHIDAWGKQQRHEQHKVDAELISTLQAAQMEMRERAEKAEAALSECRAALEVANAWRLELESPPAKPQGCTGTPSCCPDNEGYGCACTPVRTTSDAAYESLSPERRKKLDADFLLLEQRIQDHRRERERRQNKVPVEVERRVADARGTGVHQDRLGEKGVR